MTHFFTPTSDPIGAAAGHDRAIAEELRMALVAAAMSYAEALHHAESADHWTFAARRLAGLAASFGAVDLQEASRKALAATFGDEATLAQIERAIMRLQSGALQLG